MEKINGFAVNVRKMQAKTLHARVATSGKEEKLGFISVPTSMTCVVPMCIMFWKKSTDSQSEANESGFVGLVTQAFVGLESGVENFDPVRSVRKVFAP